MEMLPTIEVVYRSSGQKVIINKVDYDPQIHFVAAPKSEVEAKPEPKGEPEPKKKSGSRRSRK